MLEQYITLASILITVVLLVVAVDWRFFRDWIAVFLFKVMIDFLWGSPVSKLKMIEYPVRLLPHYYDTSILFEVWVFPILCILYNQTTRTKGLGPIICYAVLYSAAITALEYVLERYTDLITYINWTWFTSFYTLTITFLLSRSFVAFFRWGCDYFGRGR